MSLNKIYDSKFVQIYTEEGNFKKSERYEYVYRYLNSNIEDVQIYKSYQFPYNLLSISTGFLFAHPVGKERAKIPALPDYEYRDYKTNLKCLSNGFINQKDINTVMKIRPSKNCHPNCINDYIIGLNINISDKTKSQINKNDLFKHFVEIQAKFKNIKEWKQYIYKNCPINIHFAKKITNDIFKNKLTEKDMAVDYDIHDVNEIEIIKTIENTFEDMNQTVKILDNYNNIFDRIKNECDKHNIKYNSSEEVKHKNLKYKGKLKNMRYKGIRWIELKYSDLMKLNITYKLTDFIS
jgi:hypothetical protein